jgi:hypothetical protein
LIEFLILCSSTYFKDIAVLKEHFVRIEDEFALAVEAASFSGVSFFGTRLQKRYSGRRDPVSSRPSRRDETGERPNYSALEYVLCRFKNILVLEKQMLKLVIFVEDMS